MARQAEHLRLEEARRGSAPWKKWGPYLSERQWGTVRDDYSDNGDAWSYFPHDHARSRAYQWGEDGLGGICDDKQRLCFALALWNGADPILKERLFGLTNAEGNHGEDVKEYYFYLDSTPTHSYMKFLYKYPQTAFPYPALVETNQERSRFEMEYELLDTGVFDEDRYFDVFVEYAKAGPEDILVRISARNRGPDEAALDVLPTLWFRNTWSWPAGTAKPVLRGEEGGVVAQHRELGRLRLAADGNPEWLFTENETNEERLFGKPNPQPYRKDAFHARVIGGQTGAVNPERVGTKAAAWYRVRVPPGETRTLRLRLSADAAGAGDDFDHIFAARLAEADGFYDTIAPDNFTEDEYRVFRQALAGMFWTKQYYYFDVDRWLRQHGVEPLRPPRQARLRNLHWFHMLNDDVISMPDKWEYPWYAAWDLAFHTSALALADIDFAKEQLDLMLREVYLHPNGQIPAYEWNFGDVNPPVHAWATLAIYAQERELRGQGDIAFLKHAFQKLLLNFTWWVNRKDPSGRNVFEGGFLGLDNIGVFDRSKPLPTGGFLEQADGTAWMAMFAQNMLEMVLELATHDPAYEDLGHKFIEHFLWIAAAMDRAGDNHDEMWDDEEGFFYDLLRYPDGSGHRIKVRSMVGLLPLCAATVLSRETIERFPKVVRRTQQFLDRHPHLTVNIHPPEQPGAEGRWLLAVLNERKLRRVLQYMLDERRFLSPFGIRSLSKFHQANPYVFTVHGQEHRVEYWPAESHSGMFGGNSNWRGPVWFPVNALIIRALLQYYLYYGDGFKVECPAGSGREMNLFEVAREIGRRLAAIFLRDASGRRPVFGGAAKFQSDPHWRDCLLFYEYFHGDNGAGLGASHQTGWTGLVARFLQIFAMLDAEELLHGGHTRPLTKAYREE